MLNLDFGDAPARWTVSDPTSTVTTPPTRSYERISVAGGLVVVVGAAVVVVDRDGSDDRVVVVVDGTVVVVVVGVVVVGAAEVVVVVDASAVDVGTDESGTAPMVVDVVGIIAVGVSVTWSRTLPTAAAATNTAVAVTASQTRT